MPTVDLRAIDPAGHVVAVDRGAYVDETTGDRAPLPDEVRCPNGGAWMMEFAPDGAAWLLADGRFYVRAHEGWRFAVTPMCTDVAGSPWARRAQGGWSFVVHTWRRAGPAMMHTNDESGAMGWYATTALDETLTAAVLGPDRSMVTLVNGGRLILVDQTRTVAGEVLATRSEPFTSLTRTPAGIVAARDPSPTQRTLVRAADLQSEWSRVTGARPAGGATRAVWDVDIARTVAVTDGAVELSLDRGQTWSRVIDVPPTAADGGAVFERASVGTLPGRHLAVATRYGLATDDCAPAR